MKVGIVSQFNYDNIGNKLQNYALQQQLLKFADEVITIKNKSKANGLIDYLRRYSFVSELVWLNKLMNKQRNAEFLQFHKSCIRDSGKVYSFEQCKPRIRRKDQCDLYCAGSDQNWKPTTGRSGPFPYLAFAEQARTFSYAASFGVDQIPEEYQAPVRKGLQHIKYISVREDAGKKIVEDLTGRTDAQVLVDPTMLLTAQEWDQVAKKPPIDVPENYLLTYFLGEVSEKRRAAIQARAMEQHCEIINLMDRSSPYYQFGPDAFLYLIKHASCVCTDSFHGSVFSFLYRKPLAILVREGSKENMNSRLETLVEKFSLQQCVASGDELPNMDICDYSEGYAALENERAKADDYLKMVFSEAERVGLCD